MPVLAYRIKSRSENHRTMTVAGL